MQSPLAKLLACEVDLGLKLHHKAFQPTLLLILDQDELLTCMMHGCREPSFRSVKYYRGSGNCALAPNVHPIEIYGFWFKRDTDRFVN